jgi:T5orf172 domain
LTPSEPDRCPMPEMVYVLTNEVMPGLVKIGLTQDSVESRLTQLSSHTGVPLAFECYFAAEVKDGSRIERILHQLFAEYRVNPKREFFRLDPEKVVLAISIGEFKEVTPGAAQVDSEEQEALDKVKARRPRLRMEAIGIKPGDVLLFSRDDSIRATVVADGKVEYDGETLSPSAAALKALHRLGYKTPAASGSEHWMFDGELLDERRRRMEAAQFDQTPSAE